MTIINYGPISLASIQNEFGGVNPISMSEYYSDGPYVPGGTTGSYGAVPVSTNPISIRIFYGSSAVTGSGYWGGGGYGSSQITNEIDGLLFNSETAMNPAAVLAVARYSAGGVNSSTAGYSAGGVVTSASAPSNEIDGLTFSTQSATNPAATLVSARYAVGPVNSTTRGYWCGGYNSASGGTMFAEIDGIIFSTDAANNPAAALSLGRFYPGGSGNSTKGYLGAGNGSTVIDALTYSTETRTTLTATVPNPPGFSRVKATCCNSSTTGYFMGGMNSFGGSIVQIDKLIFSSETTAAVTAAVNSIRQGGNCVNSNVKGYLGGGFYSAYSSEIDGIQFSDEAVINPAATLTLARSDASSFQSGGTF